MSKEELQMKKVFLVFIGVLILVTLTATPLLAGCAAEGPAEAAMVEWLWCSTETTASHHLVIDNQKAADDVSRRTGGNFNIRITLGSELGFDRDEFLSQIQKGEIEMAHLSAGMLTGVMPELGLFVLPFLQDGTREQLYKMEAAVRPMVRQTLEERFGLTYIGSTSTTPQEVISSEKIDDWTNLSGVSIRVWRDLDARLFESLGAVPVYMPGGECYPAMQRGVITGVNTGLPAMLDRSLQELGKYVYRVGLPPGINYHLVNIEAFNALPDRYKRILYEAGADMTDRARETFLHVDGAAAAELESYGVQIIELPPEQRVAIRDIAKPIWEDYANASPTNRAYYDAAIAALGL